MKKRSLWIERIEAAWRRRSVVWLHGVRRAGKTMLCRSLADIEYFDCELPRVRRTMEDPEEFLGRLTGRRIALDEVHRLPNPSELLKIAADHYPSVRVVATGSSTLGAMTRFRDTLAGRKAEVWLTPMVLSDLRDFGLTDLPRRLLHGGLPPFLSSADWPESEYAEWMDAYWARDVQELFRLEKRVAFGRLLELLLARSGGIFEATAFAAPCEVARATITNYLGVLTATRVVHIVKPYSHRRTTEIVTAPRVYGFDTGFVCHARGWAEPRPEDLGHLFEHFVLNELQARVEGVEIRYWRDKRDHEVDFVLESRGGPPAAVECKWRADAFDPAGLRAFRRAYPEGENYVVATDVDIPFKREVSGLAVRFVGLEELVTRVAAAARRKLPARGGTPLS